MKDGLAGIFSKTDLLRRKSVGPERACRRTAPEAESAVDDVERADGLERACRRTAPEAESAVEKAVGPERDCRKTAPEAESAAEKGAVTKDTENAGDGVERADAAEDGAQSFARGVGACLGYLIRARQRRYLKCQAGADVDVGAEIAGNANDADDASEVTIVDTVGDVNADGATNVTGW